MNGRPPPQLNRRTTKFFAAGMAVILFGVVFMQGAYLPYLSQASKDGADARRQLHTETVDKGGSSSGNMWKNFEFKKKEEPSSIKSGHFTRRPPKFPTPTELPPTPRPPKRSRE